MVQEYFSWKEREKKNVCKTKQLPLSKNSGVGRINSTELSSKCVDILYISFYN